MGCVAYLVLVWLSVTGAATPHKAECNLPEHPTNGYYAVEDCPPRSALCKNIPGTPAVFGTVLGYACHAGYQLQGLEVNYCSDGVWNPEAPTCEPDISPRRCSLPDTLSHGRYAVRGCRDSDTSPVCAAVTATLVDSGTTLDYTCEAGYNLRGSTFNVCADGEWALDVPTCSPRTCKPLSSETLAIACSDGTRQRKEVPCDLPVPVGTEADLMCKPAYKEALEPGYRTIRCLPDGTWTNSLFECNPICGKRTFKGQPLIADGIDTKVSDFPWHIGVYSVKDNSLRCGGTLISPRTILTVAHCVWDRQAAGVTADRLRVTGGKYYSAWDAEDEPEKQIREVFEIHIPSDYKDFERYYADDIAILVLNEDMKLSSVVQPVCLDLNNTKGGGQLRNGSIGSVVGWGISNNGELNKALRTANIPYVDRQTCLDTAPRKKLQLVTKEKFCAGNINGSTVSRGDSGEGIAFEHDGGDHSTKLWYLRGIVSVQLDDSYTLFTDVSKYAYWITLYAKS